MCSCRGRVRTINSLQAPHFPRVPANHDQGLPFVGNTEGDGPGILELVNRIGEKIGSMVFSRVSGHGF